MFIKHLLLSLLILCVTTLAYGKDTKVDNVHYANDGSNTAIITNTLADIDNLSGLSPLDIIKNPNLLDDKWDLKPIPLSAYTEEEKQLQQLINDKTTTAVKTYSTPEQSKEWTKYDHEEITPYTWKIVELALTEANGKTFNVTLLRPNWWILNIGADRKGNRFYLKIPEVAEGSALVTNIRTNQLDTRLWNEQRNGDYVYRPITATFEHESSQVLNLYFTNSKEPIGVTAEHPFYSLDRKDFVRAENLSIGEKVKTYQGQTTLLDKTKLEGTHKVYNIEVYKDHNYMVSMDSLLVHNKGVGGKSGHGEGVFDEKDVQPYNTQKPLYGQANESSCVAGSCKMALAPNLEIPEAYIRQAIRTDIDGTRLRDVPDGLKDLGFNGSAIYREKYNIDSLKQSMEKGETVIITVRTKSGSSHAVVVDGFTDNRVIIRDPWPMETGNSYTVPINKLSEVMLDKAVTIKHLE